MKTEIAGIYIKRESRVGASLYIACSDFCTQKIGVCSCRCSSFIAKRHARLACSLASALTTTHGRYHLFASTHHFGFSVQLRSFLAISVVKNVS